MKLKETKNKEVVIGAQKEMSFNINTDNSIIFEILRSKMYTDRIGAIVREISANARDAHREANINKPVEIIIEEDELSDQATKIIFKDYGLGISPERMENIFISYTSSTKRNDNTQTGGFGLGSKTPFAYTDSFIINTIHNGIKYEYNAIIDTSNKGKIILLNQESTGEHSGTSIIIPLDKKSDLQDFKSAIDNYLRFWSDEDLIVKGHDRYVAEYMYRKNNYGFITKRNFNTLTALVDNIPYKIPNSILEDVKKITYQELIIIMDIEEVTIAVNRERVYKMMI